MENTPGHCASSCLSTYITDLGFKLNSLRISTLCLEDKHKVSQIQIGKESFTLRKTEQLEPMYLSPLSCLDTRILRVDGFEQPGR